MFSVSPAKAIGFLVNQWLFYSDSGKWFHAMVSRVYFVLLKGRMFRNLPVRKEPKIEDVTETTPVAVKEDGGGEAPMES